MTGMVALLVLALTMAGSIYYGNRGARVRTIEDWSIGGRRLGFIVFWFINAGEIYTSFAVLGISGFAWRFGAPAYLAFTSVSLASVIAYWLAPKIWEAGRQGGLVTQADFFARRFDAPWLGAVVAIAGLFASIVYVQVQLTSLALVLQLTLGGDLARTSAVVLAAMLMLGFVFAAGLRSAAFAAGVKDVLMVAFVVVLSVMACGQVGATSLADLFARAEALRPGITTFPGADPAAGLGLTWFVTSALNVAASTWFFPHMFQLNFAAASPRDLRRNAIWQPIYSLSYLSIIVLGFAALVGGGIAADSDPNAVLLRFVSHRYPDWVIGLFVGTISLLALVPGSVLLMTAGTIFGRNIVKPVLPSLKPRQELLTSRLSMIGFAALAAWLTLAANRSIVEIGLSAYSAIGMLAPGVALGLTRRRTSAHAVLCGMLVGYGVLVPASVSVWQAFLPQWEPGLVALGLNMAVVIAIDSLPLRRRVPVPA